MLGISVAKVLTCIRNATICRRDDGRSFELKEASTSVAAELARDDLFENEDWQTATHAGDADPLADVMVSDHGRVRFTSGYLAISRGCETSGGYLAVHKNKRHYYVHRLVAGTFLGQPSASCMQVNHKDGDRKNNHVQNLEYVTQSQNMLHSYLLREGQVNKLRFCKPVEARLLGSSNTWLSFETMKVAAEYTGVGSCRISECCRLQPGGCSYGAWEFRFPLEEVLADEEWRPVVLLGASAPARELEIK